MIENQTLFDQMLPPTYQQNTASIMRTNYPGYFTTRQESQRHTVSSDSRTDVGPLVCLFFLIFHRFKIVLIERFIHLIEFGWIIKNVQILNVMYQDHFQLNDCLR